jgi:dTDP-glucose pyrophosphorylase
MLIPWRPLSLSTSATLKDALRNLDDNAIQIALVVDEQETLVGTLTDGDIRRALLKDIELHADVTTAMSVAPVVGYEGEHLLAWRQKLQGKKIRHLPIVDAQHRVLGLYFDRPVSLSGLPYPVVLMLGGLGTRLRPLTQTLPKPMLKVGNRPILEHIMETLVSQGFNEFYFCINYLGHMIRDYFGNGEKWGGTIHYVEETKRMGTAGALSLLPHAMQTPFLVMNGDLLTKLDFKALMDFHIAQKAVASMCVREHEHQVPYGVIDLNDNRIARVVEKPVYRYWVNGGIYALSPQALDFVPKDEFFDMPTLVDHLIERQLNVSAFQMQDYWLDIGQMPDFEQAQTDFDEQFLVGKNER